MNTLEIALKIGKEFSTERIREYKNNPLAHLIRTEWPAAFISDLASLNPKITAKASSGIGNWNSAPFMALLDERVTKSPKRGYYPVFLYERGFNSFCLVMAQGADRLKTTLGAKEALHELKRRAPKIRIAAGDWEARGFSIGPFETYSRGNNSLGRSADDPWAVSVAFGKRYFVNNPPNFQEFVQDIVYMLELYENVFQMIGTTFTDEEDVAEMLSASGELPKSEASGLDGALKVESHKRFERRERNSKLVRGVKNILGYKCQGCGIDLSLTYGEIGKDFIEAHHLTPLSQAPNEGVLLNENNFAVLCPTCHRIIHRLGCPPLIKLQQTVSPELRYFYTHLSIQKKII